MATDHEDRQKLLLSDGTKYIELEVDSESAVKLRSDLLYAKRHMVAIEQMLPASVKQHTPGDNLEKLDYFILVNGERMVQTTQQITDETDEDMIVSDSFAWNNKSTTLLCKLRLEMNQIFHGGPRNMKMSLWNKCAKTMRQHGYINATGESCRKKWYNMMMTYKRVLDSNPGSSNWEYFNMVHAVMQQQATNDPSPSLVISTLSEPRKRRRQTVTQDTDSYDDVSHNGDLFEIPCLSNSSETYRQDNTSHREPKSRRSKDSENVLKMILKLRQEELDFQKKESERRWEEKKQKRLDRLKFQDEKLKAIQLLTETMQKLVDN